MVYKFFDRKNSGGAVTLANKSAIKNENISNKELAKGLYKPIIRKFYKRKVHLPFIENVWGEDLADTQLKSKFNKHCVKNVQIRIFFWSIFSCIWTEYRPEKRV